MATRWPVPIMAIVACLGSVSWHAPAHTKQGASEPGPAQVLASRLERQYRADPTGAIRLARELSASEDPEAQRLFVRWVHLSLARDFAPRLSADAAAGRFDDLLNALCSPPASLAARVTQGLAMWRDVLRCADADCLRERLSVDLPIEDAYGPRYQLLLLDRAESAGTAAIRAEIDGRRRALGRSLLEYYRVHTSRPTSDAVRYWAAYAVSKRSPNGQWKTMEQVDAIGTAAALTRIVGGRRTRAWWRESQALGGPQEFLTASGEFWELLARWDHVLTDRLDRALLDPRTVSSLADAYSHMHDPSSFAEYWESERWKASDRLPASILRETGAVSPAWRLLALREADTPFPAALAERLEILRATFPRQLFYLIAGAVDDRPESAPGAAPVLSIADADLDLLRVLGLPAVLLVAPDGRYVPLDPERFSDDAVRHLALTGPR
jgi:hypothetical protein